MKIFLVKRDQLSIHDVPHLDWHPVDRLHPPVPFLHLLLCPLPPIIVEQYHAGALGKGLDGAEARGVGPGRDMEEEGAEEEEDADDLQFLKLNVNAIRDYYQVHD